MTNKIFNINQLSAPDFSNKIKNNDKKSVSNDFAKILDNELNSSSDINNINSDFPLPGVSGISPLSFDQGSVEKVVSALSSVFSELDTFSSLLGNADVDMDEISPLSDKLKSDMDDILKLSESSNIPDTLKDIARESSALAYATSEKLNSIS